MAVAADCLSVLVVDEEPDILSFFARLLDANHMRALLARNAAEAIGIAKRGYVPIDVVVTDVALRPESSGPEVTGGHDLFDRIRELRPDSRALFMSAHVDGGVIRIELMDGGFETNSKNADDQGLIDSIRRAATRPMVRRAGSMSRQ
jgi:DNA-binding NtrC family response regulator